MFIVTCGGELDATIEWNSITSSGYPNNDYFDDGVCGWLLHSTGTFVHLEIVDFVIEENFDYVRIYDGADDTAPLIATLTGSDVRGTYYSSGVDMFVEFTSDGGVTAKGFELR